MSWGQWSHWGTRSGHRLRDFLTEEPLGVMTSSFPIFEQFQASFFLSPWSPFAASNRSRRACETNGFVAKSRWSSNVSTKSSWKTQMTWPKKLRLKRSPFFLVHRAGFDGTGVPFALNVEFLKFLEGLSWPCMWLPSMLQRPDRSPAVTTLATKISRDDPQCSHMWWAYWISAFFRSWDQLESGFPGRFGTKPQKLPKSKTHDDWQLAAWFWQFAKSSNVRKDRQNLKTYNLWGLGLRGLAGTLLHRSILGRKSHGTAVNHLSRINVFFFWNCRLDGGAGSVQKNSYPESWCEIKPI